MSYVITGLINMI